MFVIVVIVVVLMPDNSCKVCKKKVSFFCWLCKLCIKDIFTFSDITDQELNLLNSSDAVVELHQLSYKLNIFPSNYNNDLFKNLNDYFASQALGCSTDEEEELSSNLINCKYFNIDDFCASNFDSSNSFSVFHLNIASLNAHFDEFTTMLSLLEFDFSVIGLTEAKLKKYINSTIPISIKGYNLEQTLLKLLVEVLFYTSLKNYNINLETILRICFCRDNNFKKI